MRGKLNREEIEETATGTKVEFIVWTLVNSYKSLKTSMEEYNNFQRRTLAEFYKPYLTLFHRLLNQKYIKLQLKVFNTELAYFLDNVILI